ncbi:MAG: DUF3604 domain-containing protein, partial [Alphaproteobacteria bacterium]
MAISVLMGLLLAACAPQSDTPAKLTEAPKLPVGRPAPNPLRNAYFGDLHLHTRNSFDAYIFNVRASPDDAYAYAKGGTIKHAMGFDLHLNSGPLDFLAVTDHSEYLGVLPAINTAGTQFSKVPYAKDLFSSDTKVVLGAFRQFADSVEAGKRIDDFKDMATTASAWNETIKSAERANDPGKFTSFIAYEFTSAPGGRNLHRNVIFSGDKAPSLPFSALESQNPEDLWRWLDERRAEGIEALSISHNANGSDGTMFERTMWNGKPIDVLTTDGEFHA